MSRKSQSPGRTLGKETERDIQPDEPVIVSRNGDLILVVEKEEGQNQVLYRCDSARLKEGSLYFKRMLESTNFQEGATVAKQQAELQGKYRNATDADNAELPHIKVTYIGEVCIAKSIRTLMTDFFRILHGYDILTASRSPPAVNIANLSIVADRFDAIPAVAQWCRSKKNVLPRIIPSQPVYDEELYRQRLLVSLLFRNESRHAMYSNHMILQGSIMWRGHVKCPNEGLWWDLPRGLEGEGRPRTDPVHSDATKLVTEEMQYRRTCVFETILSLQNHILRLYTARERQCKLGYDSSPQCDSFQLGQFVKFLVRLGTLQFNGPWEVNSNAEKLYDGDIRALIKDLRATPAYQVDSNHSHCGPRKLLSQGLDFIQKKLDEASLGICLQCWQEAQDKDHFWSRSKRQPYFNNLVAIRLAPKVAGSCDLGRLHEHARDLFTADEINWASLLANR